MTLALDLSTEKFERQIAEERAKGALEQEEARWLTLAVKTFLGVKHEALPFVANDAFRRFNKKLPGLKLNGNVLEISKIGGIVTLHTPKPRLLGRLNVLA